MDQDALRKFYRDMNERYCLFEKGVLSGQCSCSQSEKFYLAEREGVHCRSARGQHLCETLLTLLRQQARFTLKYANQTSALPHAKAMRIQIGGLQGLFMLLNAGEELPAVVQDVYALLESAVNTFESLDQLPFQEIIKQVAAYKGRNRRSGS
ncbi:MAG: hypothetical protein KDI43_04860 [Gammaproteobacteria bacterium]|nr:hypothetical protein [Gammaproteobacteria bacterium]MCP5409918.1 hypothetical protein [Chromatiaceae bacterium]MCP5443200.1 hypothetical protein [Chromatiaceae bacterium]